jgi:hypothetical protein
VEGATSVVVRELAGARFVLVATTSGLATPVPTRVMLEALSTQFIFSALCCDRISNPVHSAAGSNRLIQSG